MLFLPYIAHAQGLAPKATGNPAITAIVGRIINVIVTPIVEGLFIFTILMFIWGVVQMIRNGDDAEARGKGQQHILWSVIGMFIMISAYGIIRLIGETVGVGDPFL